MAFFNLGKIGIGKTTLLFGDAYEKRFCQWILENYKSVLSDLGIKFHYIPDFKMPSGYELVMCGALSDFDKFQEENKIILEELKVGRLIVCSDEAYWTFKKYYKDIDVVHVLDLISEQSHQLLQNYKDSVVYYDTVYMRESNVIDSPRKILRALGCKVDEYPGKAGFVFTGCEALLDFNSPTMSEKLAKYFLSKIKGKKLVVSSARVYEHLKQYASEYGVDIKELSEYLVEI